MEQRTIVVDMDIVVVDVGSPLGWLLLVGQ